MATQQKTKFAIGDGPCGEYLRGLSLGQHWYIRDRTARFSTSDGITYEVLIGTATESTDARFPWIIEGTVYLSGGTPTCEHAVTVEIHYAHHERRGTIEWGEVRWARTVGRTRGSTVRCAD